MKVYLDEKLRDERLLKPEITKTMSDSNSIDDTKNMVSVIKRYPKASLLDLGIFYKNSTRKIDLSMKIDCLTKAVIETQRFNEIRIGFYASEAVLMKAVSSMLLSLQRIKKLDIVLYEACVESVNHLEILLAKNNSLTDVKLTLRAINRDNIEILKILSQLLSNYSCINELCIDECIFDEESLTMLIQSISCNRFVERLSFNRITFDNNQMKLILNIFKENKCIKHFDLLNISYSEHNLGIKEFFDVLSSNDTLKSLNISGSEGIIKSSFSYLCAGLKENRGLNSIRFKEGVLKKDQIDPEAVLSVACYAVVLSAIFGLKSRNIMMEYNECNNKVVVSTDSLRQQDLILLSDVIQMNTQLKEIDFSMSNDSIDWMTFIALCNAIGKNSSLKKLKVGNFDIDEQSFDVLLSVLKNHISLNTVILKNLRVAKLDKDIMNLIVKNILQSTNNLSSFSYRRCSTPMLEFFGDGTFVNNNLSKIDIDDPIDTTEKLKSVEAFLRNNPQIIAIRLSRSNIDENDFVGVMKLLSANRGYIPLRFAWIFYKILVHDNDHSKATFQRLSLELLMRILMLSLPDYISNYIENDYKANFKRNYIVGVSKSVANIVCKRQQSLLNRVSFWRANPTIEWKDTSSNKMELQSNATGSGCVIA